MSITQQFSCNGTLSHKLGGKKNNEKEHINLFVFAFASSSVISPCLSLNIAYLPLNNQMKHNIATDLANTTIVINSAPQNKESLLRSD